MLLYVRHLIEARLLAGVLMIRLHAKKGLLNDVRQGVHRAHLVGVTNLTRGLQVGQLVHLYYRSDPTVAVEITAASTYQSLGELFANMPAKLLHPEARNAKQARRTIKRQFNSFQNTGLRVFTYRLVIEPSE